MKARNRQEHIGTQRPLRGLRGWRGTLKNTEGQTGRDVNRENEEEHRDTQGNKEEQRGTQRNTEEQRERGDRERGVKNYGRGRQQQREGEEFTGHVTLKPGSNEFH